MGNGLDSNTKLLLHFNGDGNDGAKEIINSANSVNTGHIVTQVATAQLDTSVKKFGSSSLSLDGNSDYLTIPDSDDWQLGGGTGNFTIDLWARFTSISVKSGFVSQTTDGNNAWTWIWRNDTGRMWFSCYASGYTIRIGSDWVPSINTWYHLALVRKGTGTGDMTIYIDGVDQFATLDSGAWGGEIVDMTGNLNVGKGTPTHYNAPMQGLIDEFRISNVARWVSNFTPPTEGYESDADTKLLLHMNTHDVSGDGGSDNYHVSDFIATAQIDTAVKKFGSGSLLLDGNSDYLTIPDSNDWNIFATTTEDWTIDFWYNGTGSATQDCVIYKGPIGGYYRVQIQTTGKVRVQRYNGVTGDNIDSDAGSVPFDGNWHHIAVVVKAKTTSIELGVYVDGDLKGYQNSTFIISPVGLLSIGVHDNTSPVNYLEGSLDELRIQKSNYFGVDPSVDSTITVPTEEYSIDPITGRRIVNQSIIIT